MLDCKIFQAVFNSSPVGEVLPGITPGFPILAVNRAFLATSCRRETDLVGKQLFDAFPACPGDPQDTGVAALHRSISEALATGQTQRMPQQRYPIAVQLADGSEVFEERFWSASNTPIFDAGGSLLCISHRTEDVTERTRAEALAQRQAARQAFQLALADRIRPLADPREVTAAASELLGRTLGAKRVVYGEVDDSGEFLAMQPDWSDGTLGSLAGARLTLNDFGPLIADAARAGRVLAVRDITRHEHSSAYAQAYMANGVRSFMGIPLVKDGRLRAILNVHDSGAHDWSADDIAMADDMVDRTWFALDSARAPARLRVAHERTRSVFDGMAEGFALFARDWTVLEMNAAGLRLSHRTREQAIGRNHWDVWPETHGTSSERKVAETVLREADRRKDEFLAMLAHELRNPLAPIGAAARLLQMAQLDEARVRHTSRIIGRQVDHMTHLINDLLDVSRVTRGLVELDRAPLGVGQIVSDAVEQVTPLIQARGHRLDLQLPADGAMVSGDKKRLVQVLTNILNNAAKYTPEGGRIRLEVQVQEAAVVIGISDNGIGMTPELAAHAFELFAQAERSSDRSGGGLGLGLALVKSLVELHGGHVRCASAGLGKGSTFTVCLPRLAGPAPTEPDAGHADTVMPDAAAACGC